jgi:hypothetical protein
MDLATLHMVTPFDSHYFSAASHDLVSRLLHRDPAARLGARGADEIKRHPWFAPLDWGSLAAGLLDPPFVPERTINAASQGVIGAFLDEGDPASLSDRDQARWRGWEEVNRRLAQMEMVEYLAWLTSPPGVAGLRGWLALERAAARARRAARTRDAHARAGATVRPATGGSGATGSGSAGGGASADVSVAAGVGGARAHASAPDDGAGVCSVS